MFPWGHLAVGYLCYSVLCHLAGRRPGEYPTLALALGTQFPDLVDKPLSWMFDLLPAGVFAHTVFVAVPVWIVVLAVAYWRSRTSIGFAFVVGYASHLPADVLPSVALGNELNYWFLFWPVMARPGVDVSDPIVGPGAGAGLIANADYYFVQYVQQLLGPVLVAYVGLFVLVFVLWLYDGHPGIRALGNVVRRSTGRESL